MDTLLIACIPAVITGAFSYLVATKKANTDLKSAQTDFDNKLTELEKSNELSLKTMETEFSLNSQSKEKDIQNEIANKVINGELSLDKLMELKKQADRYNK